MLYEIFFDARAAVWRIRIITLYLWFIPVSRLVHEKSETEPVYTPRGFTTYEKANEYAGEVGLGKAYRRRNRLAAYSSWLHAEGCHAQS